MDGEGSGLAGWTAFDLLLLVQVFEDLRCSSCVMSVTDSYAASARAALTFSDLVVQVGRDINR